jgi:hypothetical protein
VAAESVRKFRRVTKEIGKLSTTQKIFGGVGLLAAGITYLANKHAIDQNLAAADGPLAGLLGMGNSQEKPAKEEVDDKSAPASLRSSKGKVASKAQRLESKAAS